MKQLLTKREFDRIRTIEDVKENGQYPWERWREIKLFEKEVGGNKLYIAHYMLSFEELWKSQINREMRGIMFDSEGKLLSRPFHKFFNVGELEETHESKLRDRKFFVAEKIDGALIIPEVLDNTIYFRTKKSFTSDEAKLVYEYLRLKDKKDVEEFLDLIMHFRENGYTPLFEFVWSEKYPHIVNYEEPKLYLLALRKNDTGEYFHPVNDISNDIFEIVYNLRDKFTLDEVKEALKEKQKNFEGFNLADDYDFYKIKTEWYIRLHSVSDKITIKRVIELTLREELDDLKSFLSINGQMHLYKKVLEYEEKFRKLYEDIMTLVDLIYRTIYTPDRKEFFARLEEKLKEYNNKSQLKGLLRYYLVSRYIGKRDIEREIRLWKQMF